MQLKNIDPVFVEFIPEELEEGKIYISREYKTASHLCACGCGKLVVTPFSGCGITWSLIERAGLVTINGSIGNRGFECSSHYLIQENRIIWDSPFK